MAELSTQERQNRETCMRIADRLWNKRDYDVVDEDYDPLVELHAHSEPETAHGTKGIKAFAKKYHEAFSDFHVDLFDVVTKGNHVYARYRIKGTHDGTLRSVVGDVPATHREMETWGITEIRFDGGLVVEEWNSTDTMTMANQLGVAPE